VAAQEPSPASAPASKQDRSELRMKLQQLAKKHKVSFRQHCYSSISACTAGSMPAQIICLPLLAAHMHHMCISEDLRIRHMKHCCWRASSSASSQV
jgi:hypothetical protein